MPPHHSRPAASANVQLELVTVTSLKPPARTHSGRWRPASASARLRVVSWWYSSSHRDSRSLAGDQKNAGVVAVAHGEDAAGPQARGWPR